jgi:hypothetical protein
VVSSHILDLKEQLNRKGASYSHLYLLFIVLGGLVRIFETEWIARFARREGISDKSLREAIERAESGLIDADLGGGIIKQRVARQGQGRSGGDRLIDGYRMKDWAVLFLGFAKNERENIEGNDCSLSGKRPENGLLLTSPGCRRTSS